MTERLNNPNDLLDEEIGFPQQLMYVPTEDDIPTCVRKKNTKTVRVPKIQSMLNYMMKHYKGIIIEELRQRIIRKEVDLELNGTGNLYVDKKHFRANIDTVNFWRIHQFCVQADIYISVGLHAVIDNKPYVFPRTFCLEMLFDMSEEYEHWFEKCYLRQNVPQRELWPLSNYLIPVLSKSQIDEGAEELLWHYAPNNWDDTDEYKAERLAEKLGLSVVRYPLYKQARTLSILYFCDSDVLVQEKPQDDDEPEPPHKEHVPALSIVINTNAVHKDYCQLEIYHECIHYYWHYLFYRLQDMHNNDICKIKAHRQVIEDGQPVDTPLKWMEWQARRGSFGLMMPRRCMLEVIQKRLDDLVEAKMHNGEKMEMIARGIARKYVLPKFRVRARLIQLGYIHAKGALNYVDGKYIKPFDFSPKNYENDYTFVVDRKCLLELFRTNEQIRELLESGKYVYADGHVCLNSPEYVQQGDDGFELTPWANAHVDRCCLRFICVYEQVGYTDYVFGCLNSDDDYNGPQIAFAESCSLSNAEQLNRMYAAFTGMPDSFHEALTYLMNETGTTSEALEGETGISVRSISRLRTEERESYSLDQIITLCIGLHIPPWVSYELLDRAGLKLKNTKRQVLYRYILTAMYQETLENVQAFILSTGETVLKP